MPKFSKTFYKRVDRVVESSLREIFRQSGNSEPGSYHVSAERINPASVSLVLSLEQCQATGAAAQTPEDPEVLGEQFENLRLLSDELDIPEGGLELQLGVSPLESYPSTNTGDTIACDSESFTRQTTAWSIGSSIPHGSVTQLLEILRSPSCFSTTPNTARSLLQTPRVADKGEAMDSGK